MNSDEMTGIMVNIPILPNKKLKLKRQESYSVEKYNDADTFKVKIKMLEDLVKYWRNKATKSKIEYETLVKTTLEKNILLI